MTAKQPDWEAIERAFRAGLLSLRAIAERNGITEGAIRKRAKKEGWQRDLTSQVKSAAQEKLTRAVVRKPSTQEEKVRTEAQIIEEASEEVADVVLAHRASLGQWRRIAGKLCKALDDMEVTAENHGEFARSLNSGVDAQLKVIKGERQAYNLDTEEGDKSINELSALMDALSTEA